MPDISAQQKRRWEMSQQFGRNSHRKSIKINQLIQTLFFHRYFQSEAPYTINALHTCRPSNRMLCLYIVCIVSPLLDCECSVWKLWSQISREIINTRLQIFPDFNWCKQLNVQTNQHPMRKYWQLWAGRHSDVTTERLFVPEPQWDQNRRIFLHWKRSTGGFSQWKWYFHSAWSRSFVLLLHHMFHWSDWLTLAHDRQMGHPVTCPFPNSFHGRLPRWLCVSNHLAHQVNVTQLFDWTMANVTNRSAKQNVDRRCQRQCLETVFVF